MAVAAGARSRRRARATTSASPCTGTASWLVRSSCWRRLGLAERAGHVDLTRFAQGMMLLPALDGGRWDECVRLADAFIAECEAGAPHTLQASAHCHRGSIRLARDDLEGAVADAERALELAREVQQPDRMFQSLAFAVRAFAGSGAPERAREHASEFDFLALGGDAHRRRGRPSISPGQHRTSDTPTNSIGCSRVRSGRRSGSRHAGDREGRVRGSRGVVRGDGNSAARGVRAPPRGRDARRERSARPGRRAARAGARILSYGRRKPMSP